MQASRHLKPQLNTLYVFYSILTDILGLTKAALLLSIDRYKQFRPWCAQGFDDTSLLQLRINKTDISFPDQQEILGSPDALDFSRFFSGKDYGTMESLLFLPIYSGKRLQGILVLADNPYLGLGPLERSMIFRPIQDLLRQMIELHLALTDIPLPLEPKLVEEALRDGEEKKLLLQARDGVPLVDFAFGETVAYLQKEYPNLLSDAAHFDIRMRLLNNIQQLAQRCYGSPGHCYVLLKPETAAELPSVVKLAAIELSESMISTMEYAPNIAASMKSLAVAQFMELGKGNQAQPA